MNDISCDASLRDAFLRPKMIRQRAHQMLEYCRQGHTHFELDESELEKTASFVVTVIKKNYPTLKIPLHSRWGHFKAGQIDRVSDLEHCLRGLDSLEVARSQMDLVVVSVLLDAGAGDDWNYVEEESGLILSRSEGLAVASFHMFLQGDFSSDGQSARVDAQGLENLTLEKLKEGFQVSDQNPLVAVESRLKLLKSLGQTMLSSKEYFKEERPGDLILKGQELFGESIKAQDLLNLVLLSLGPIWPGRLSLNGFNMGDCWFYSPWAKDEQDLEGLVPFHKLSQWLTYSLVAPFEKAGIKVCDLEEMTGLPEYRNGGLLIDSGVLKLKDQALAQVAHAPSSDLIIEWRALTVALLDLLAVQIRNDLGLNEKNFPLGKILEGGTWAAGREMAKKLRKNASPPLKIDSDGTVF